MNIKEKKLKNASTELEIEVPVDRVEVEYKSVFYKIQKSAKIDGFRQGKAPVEIIEKRYSEYADQEVAENLLKSTFIDAITEKQLNPIAEPHYDFQTIKRGEPFVYKATFDTPPTLELGKYTEIAGEERSCELKDKDIEKEMETLLEQHAEVTKKEDPGAQVEKGNLVRIKMKRIDDVDQDKRDEVQFKEYPIIVGRVAQDSILDNQLIGMKVSEEKEIGVKYPKDYYVKELAGQKASYLVLVNEINDRKLPELNDEFARNIGYESVDDFRKKSRDYMEKFIEEKSSGEVKSQILKTVIDNSTFEIPETMILSEMMELFNRTQQRFGTAFETIDQFASVAGINAEEFTKKLREEALFSIQKTLLLFEIAKKENLQVSEEMFNNFISSYAERSNMKEDDVRKIIEENRTRDNIEHELLLTSAIDFLYNHAKIKKKKAIPFEEFIKENS